MKLIALMPQDPSSMPGMTPAFMNQPQYQQQMQGLAMQVRQQEEGTKKIKKFLKAYEDIQLSAPMMQPQAPMQPGFMGGGGQPPMMQAPGGRVASGNNNLPRNDMTEPAPTSFTEMAGGSVPPEPTYEEAPIGEEEATGGIPSQGSSGGYGEARAKLIKAYAAKEHHIDEFNRVAGTPEYEKNYTVYDQRLQDARDRLGEMEGMAKQYGIDIDDPDFQRSVDAERARMGRAAKATPGRDPENDPTIRRNKVEVDEEWDQGFKIGDDVSPPTGRDKSEDGTPLEQRGDWDASRKTRQDDRKKMDAKERAKGKEAAIDKAIFGDKEAIKRYDEIDAQMKKIEQDLIKKGSSYRTGDGAFGQKQWADTSVAADFSTEEGKKVKAEYERLRAERNKARWAVEKAQKSTTKLKQMSFSKPNKAMGIAGLASGMLAGASASANELFQPEDAEIFLGRISKDKDFNKLNAREKAAVQKFLEYKAESDSLSGRSGLPRNASDQPIEYSSAQKALMSQ